MDRSRIDTRLEQLVSAGTRVFIARGYRRTSMADVARAMGVAPGTLYLYVESKEALFHLLVMRTLVSEEGEPPRLPIRTPPPTETIEVLRGALALSAYAPRLAGAIAQGSALEGERGLEAVVAELYDAAYDHRAGINLVERSAMDWPEMADLFYRGLRPQIVDAIARYLELGIAAGRLRSVANVPVCARFVLETIAWFAIHRHGDPGGLDFDDETAREAAIDMVVAALRADGTPVPGSGGAGCEAEGGAA